MPRFTAAFGATAENEELAPGQDYWSLGGLLVFTAVGSRYTLSADVGYDAAVGGARGDERGALALDVAWGYQATRRVQPEVEFNYARGLVAHADDSNGVGISAGVILNLSPSSRLDLGLQQIVSGRNTNRGTSFLANFSTTF